MLSHDFLPCRHITSYPLLVAASWLKKDGGYPALVKLVNTSALSTDAVRLPVSSTGRRTNKSRVALE